MPGYVERMKASAVCTRIAKLNGVMDVADIEQLVWALAILSGKQESEIWAMQQDEWERLIDGVARKVIIYATLANVIVGKDNLL